MEIVPADGHWIGYCETCTWTDRQPAAVGLQFIGTIKKIFNEQGFTLIGLEGDQMNMNRIKLGLEGREKDADLYCQMLQNMGRLGLDFICYNFMFTGWYRTHKALAERGGALYPLHQPHHFLFRDAA